MTGISVIEFTGRILHAFQPPFFLVDRSVDYLKLGLFIPKQTPELISIFRKNSLL
jgi:hypothetical protein